VDGPLVLQENGAPKKTFGAEKRSERVEKDERNAHSLGVHSIKKKRFQAS